MRILAAIDDAELRTAVTEALEPEGHQLSYSDGLQAVALCQSSPPDLLLTSFNLAQLGGLDLARLIQLSCRQQFVPILMFTSPAEPEYFQKCLEAGVIEFISSPFAPGELRCRVQTVARLVRLQQSLLKEQSDSRQELAEVKHLLSRLAATDNPATPGFHMETVQTRRVNGDACVYRQSIPGVHFGLICDATGHGLMAGVSTIPVL